MRKGKDEFISELQRKEKFWASPGEYLQRATLVALAKNISGLCLPESIYHDTTFPGNVGGQDPSETAMILTSDLRNAALASVKKGEKLENSGYDDTESEDESDDEMDVDEMEASA
jgi:hypothetical protein